MQSNDVTKPLSLHTNYGDRHLSLRWINLRCLADLGLDIFELDMTVSHYIGSPPVAPELVENSRKSIGVTNPSSWTSRQLFAIHGLLLAFSFVFMMPLGIAGIRSGSKKSFKIHWIIQVSAVCIAIIAIFLGIYLAWGNPVRVMRTLTCSKDGNAKTCDRWPHYMVLTNSLGSWSSSLWFSPLCLATCIMCDICSLVELQESQPGIVVLELRCWLAVGAMFFCRSKTSVMLNPLVLH